MVQLFVKNGQVRNYQGDHSGPGQDQDQFSGSNGDPLSMPQHCPRNTTMLWAVCLPAGHGLTPGRRIWTGAKSNVLIQRQDSGGLCQSSFAKDRRAVGGEAPIPTFSCHGAGNPK